MATQQMAIATVRELKDRWAKELIASFPSQVLSADSSGNPVLTLSADATPATGEKVAVVRCMPLARASSLDVLGNAQQIYSPMVLQVVTEANYAGATDSVADILSAADLFRLYAGLASKGMVVEVYQSANGTVPSTTQISSTNLQLTYHPNMYQGFGAAI